MTVLKLDQAGRVFGSGHLRVAALDNVSLRVGVGEFGLHAECGAPWLHLFASGTAVKRFGRHWHGYCPWHDDYSR